MLDELLRCPFCIIVCTFDSFHINFVFDHANREAEDGLRSEYLRPLLRLNANPTGRFHFGQEYLAPLHHLVLLLVELKQVLLVELLLLQLTPVKRFGCHIHLAVGVDQSGLTLVLEKVKLVPDLVDTLTAILHEEAVAGINIVHLLQVNLLQLIGEVAALGIVVLIQLTLILQIVVLNDLLDQRLLLNLWDGHVVVQELEGVVEQTGK